MNTVLGMELRAYVTVLSYLLAPLFLLGATLSVLGHPGLLLTISVPGTPLVLGGMWLPQHWVEASSVMD